MTQSKTYSAKQVASRIGTDAKTLRKFFRDPKSGFDAVGQGGRYDFTEDSVPVIKKAFDAWNAGKTKRNRAPRSAEGKLADKAGITPRKRTAPDPGGAPEPRKYDPKNGLHGLPIDDDTFEERTTGIAARVARHRLKTNQQGRFVPRQLTAAELYEAIEDPDAEGLELELEDDGDMPDTGEEIPYNELQGLVDYMEREQNEQ
jgi:hypothetical protein